MREFARVQDQALSLDCFDPIQSFPECGGIDIFIGTVRNHHEGKAVKALKYTSYTPVAEKMIREIEQQIKDKYQVSYVRVMHRIGYLDVSETAIIAIAYAAHRRDQGRVAVADAVAQLPDDHHLRAGRVHGPADLARHDLIQLRV